MDIEVIGSDWIELFADQNTLIYTSEGQRVFQFDTSGGGQLADFNPALPLPGSNAFALRLLPPGDGSGGLLVADREDIKRLDAGGNVVASYDVIGHDSWFALNLDPDGTSFWSGDFGTSNFQRFDIASTAAIGAPINTGTIAGTLFGLCVLGEPTAAQVTEVDIDVKAFSDPNGFNCKKKGVLPVTIWGTDTFDVSDINLATVQLKLTDGTDVGGPVVNSLICDRGDPVLDTGSSGGAPLVADCFDAIGDPGQDGVPDKEGGTLDGFDDIDVRFAAQTVIGNICDGATKRDVIPIEGLVIMGERNDGSMFTSLPIPDEGVDQLLVQQVPRP